MTTSLKADEKNKLAKIFSNLNMDKSEKHVIFCAGNKCCNIDDGLEVWKHLKGRLKSPELQHVNRTKAGCLRMCQDGPVMVVYPDGVWYARVDKDTCDQIIDQHLIGGKIVESHAFAEKKLIS